MPYYLFKISPNHQFDLMKDLELLDVFTDFRRAKTQVRDLRARWSGEGSDFKIMFADNQLSAEEQLLKKSDKPVLMEHER